MSTPTRLSNAAAPGRRESRERRGRQMPAPARRQGSRRAIQETPYSVANCAPSDNAVLAGSLLNIGPKRKCAPTETGFRVGLKGEARWRWKREVRQRVGTAHRRKPSPRSRLDRRARIEGFASVLSWNVARDHGEPGQWPSSQATTKLDTRGERRSDLAPMLDARCSRANMQATSVGKLLAVATHRRSKAPSATTPQQHISAGEPVSPQPSVRPRSTPRAPPKPTGRFRLAKASPYRITLYAHKVLEMSAGAVPKHRGGCGVDRRSPITTGDKTVQRRGTLRDVWGRFAPVPHSSTPARSARGLANSNASATRRASSSRGA
jgi:hypothetical protein